MDGIYSIPKLSKKQQAVERRKSMAIKRGTEIPTIDVALVTIEAGTGENKKEIALDTASKIEVEPQIEESDAVKLIVKGVLKAQKPQVSTLTGNEITLTDNVFTPELVQILQGGIIYYWTDENHSAKQTTQTAYGIAGYTPPLPSSKNKGELFILNAYSVQYDASGQIVQYEKISYPNCRGTVTGFGSEDDVFRAPEYVITSAPKEDEPPYTIEYLDEIPEIQDGYVNAA